LLVTPEWLRTCAACQEHVYRDDDETPAEHRGEKMLIRGKPVPRGGSLPPCWKCPKVPLAVRKERQRSGKEVTPADAADPGPEHYAIVEHFLRCDAVGQFPDDEIVKRHAGIIRPYKDAADRRPLETLIGLVVASQVKRRRR
jgi:hypothetical protein